MANVGTIAKTYAFPRLDLIKLQVFLLIQKTSNLSDAARIFLDDMLNNKAISKVRIYGVGKNDLCSIYLDLDISWDIYNKNIANGKATIYIDDRWKDSFSYDISEPALFFNNIVKKQDLRSNWCFYYVDAEIGARMNNKHGTRYTDPIKYTHDLEIQLKNNVDGADELGIGVAF